VLSLEDPDPLFEAFLTAGAARVLVPVHPAFAHAVLYFQLTGLIWPGGSVPALYPDSDPEVRTYNAYLRELGDPDANDDADKEVPIDKADPDTWLVKVPTTLVWLQPDSKLPNFEA
jgi:hypothetical protein